jgi:hypothetical protein
MLNIFRSNKTQPPNFTHETANIDKFIFIVGQKRSSVIGYEFSYENYLWESYVPNSPNIHVVEMLKLQKNWLLVRPRKIIT